MSLISNFFDLEYGNRDYTNKSMLDKGTTVLISSQGIDNGVYGFFDIPVKYNPPIITVPRTGSIGYAFVQLKPCNVTDDCIVLKPKKNYPVEYLYYVAAAIRSTRWRYNYGRKITPKRLAQLNVRDEYDFNVSLSYTSLNKKLYPLKKPVSDNQSSKHQLGYFNIADLFNIKRGDFHAISKLDRGIYPTISRTSTQNGLAGFYDKPKGAKVYQPKTITVSTVTGDAFMQICPFIATDNVLILEPRKPFEVETLLYATAALNLVKWRYSYGRQPYKRIFQKTVITMPILKARQIDQNYIKNLVNSQPYWQALSKLLS